MRAQYLEWCGPMVVLHSDWCTNNNHLTPPDLPWSLIQPAWSPSFTPSWWGYYWLLLADLPPHSNNPDYLHSALPLNSRLHYYWIFFLSTTNYGEQWYAWYGHYPITRAPNNTIMMTGSDGYSQYEVSEFINKSQSLFCQETKCSQSLTHNC